MLTKRKTITRWTEDGLFAGEYEVRFQVSPCLLDDDVEIHTVTCDGEGFELTDDEYAEIRHEWRKYAREGVFNG
jgi:hypothetical protein